MGKIQKIQKNTKNEKNLYHMYMFFMICGEKTAHLWLKTTHLGEAKVGSSSQTLQKGCSSMPVGTPFFCL